MKSGLGDRSNTDLQVEARIYGMAVSMKSGLRDRNNKRHFMQCNKAHSTVSMESGLRDRNNTPNDLISYQATMSQ